MAHGLVDMLNELQVCLDMPEGSPAWTEMFVEQFGFRKEWLKHYGCRIMFEKLDQERRYDEMMELLDADEERKCFLLHHVYNSTDDWFYISKEHNVFKDLLNEHVKTYVKKLDDTQRPTHGNKSESSEYILMEKAWEREEQIQNDLAKEDAQERLERGEI